MHVDDEAHLDMAVDFDHSSHCLSIYHLHTTGEDCYINKQLVSCLHVLIYASSAEHRKCVGVHEILGEYNNHGTYKVYLTTTADDKNYVCRTDGVPAMAVTMFRQLVNAIDPTTMPPVMQQVV